MADQEKIDFFTSLTEDEFAKLPRLDETELKEDLRLGEEERRSMENAGIPTMILPQMLFR